MIIQEEGPWYNQLSFLKYVYIFFFFYQILLIGIGKNKLNLSDLFYNYDWMDYRFLYINQIYWFGKVWDNKCCNDTIWIE